MNAYTIQMSRSVGIGKIINDPESGGFSIEITSLKNSFIGWQKIKIFGNIAKSLFSVEESPKCVQHLKDIKPINT